MDIAEKNVRAVVQHYLEGMIYGDAAKLELAFHPQAQIAGNWEGAYEIIARDPFITTCVDAKDQAAGTAIVAAIVSVDITADVALVKLTDTCFGCDFTDYLSLVKHKEQWQIISKVYCVHSS